MRSLSDVNDHTIDMINAILLGDYNTAGSILSSYDISLTVKLDEKTTVEHILLSKDSKLINLFIKQYQSWDLSESKISLNLINTIYDFFSRNPGHLVYLSVSSDSYGMFNLSRLNHLRNIKIDIPIPTSVTASLGREYQDLEFEPSSPSKCDKKSLMHYIKTSPTMRSLKNEADSLMFAVADCEGEVTRTPDEQENTGQMAAGAYYEREVTVISGAQANSAEMAAEEISTWQMNVGSADFDPGEDDELIFDMEEEEERESVNDYGMG